jgi:hypothetical protein
MELKKNLHEGCGISPLQHISLSATYVIIVQNPFAPNEKFLRKLSRKGCKLVFID